MHGFRRNAFIFRALFYQEFSHYSCNINTLSFLSRLYVDTQRSSSIRRPFEEFDLSAHAISITLGTSTFLNPSALIHINGEDVLALKPPAEGHGFPQLSGVFYDSVGNESFRISDSTWKGPADAWDIQVVGRRVTVKMEQNRTALALEISPPNSIVITHLDMFKDNCHLLCNDDRLLVGQVHHSGKSYVELGKFKCHGAKVGIAVNSQAGSPPRPSGLRMMGGGGITLDGTGISVCNESGPMEIGQIKVWSE